MRRGPRFQRYARPPTFRAAQGNHCQIRRPNASERSIRAPRGTPGSHTTADHRQSSPHKATAARFAHRTRAKGPFVHPGDPQVQRYRRAPTVSVANSSRCEIRRTIPSESPIHAPGGPPVSTLRQTTDKSGPARAVCPQPDRVQTGRKSLSSVGNPTAVVAPPRRVRDRSQQVASPSHRRVRRGGGRRGALWTKTGLVSS
jgi:hypothetical protein